MKALPGSGTGTARWTGVALGALLLATPSAAGRVTLPLVCSAGPSGQHFDVGVTIPTQVDAGAIYTVRLDGVGSGKISHFGLNHIHHMTVQYVLPPGAYVDGSAELVPGTGTQNVLGSPMLWYHKGILTMVLPDKVQNGTEYTPPSIRFSLRAAGAPGSSAAVALRRFDLTANAVVVGDLAVTCEPTPVPYPIGTTVITQSPPGGASM
jgi:hypothetical protein